MKLPSLKGLVFGTVYGVMSLFLLGTIAVNVWQKRLYLDEQLFLVSQDTAFSLGLSLSSVADPEDWVAATSMVDAIFDSGAYQAIQLESPLGEPILLRQAELSLDGVPPWFIRTFKLSTPEARADVVSGWRQVAVLTVVSHPGAAYFELWRTVRNQFILFAGVSLVTLLSLSLLVHRLMKPLSELEKAAGKVSRSDFSDRLPLPNTRELRSVAEAVNTMTAALQFTFDRQIKTIESLRSQLLSDELTGLLNRAAFDRRLQGCLDDEQDCRGVLMVAELPMLLRLNLNIGRAGADAVIRDVAVIVATALQKIDGAFAGRTSAGTIACYLPFPRVNDAEALAEIIAEEHQKQTVVNKQFLAQIRIRFIFAHGQASAAQLFADLSLEGMCFPSPTGQPKLKSSQFTNAAPQALHPSVSPENYWHDVLVDALDNDKLVLFSQPAVADLKQPRETLFQQVLVRFQAESSLYIAAEVIPYAERLGLSLQLDLAVTEKILKRIKYNGVDKNFAVFLSVFSLQNAALDLCLRKLLKRYNGHCQRLLFTLPGWAVVNGQAGFDRLLQLRNEFGFRIVVSRLGVSEKSIVPLRGYLLDIILLDPALIVGIETDEPRLLYLRSIIELAHARGTKVIVAGLEQKSVWPLLSSAGVDGAAGYLVGQPKILPAIDQSAK